MLIYAKGEADTGCYKVRHCGKVLKVAALDLSGNLEDALGRVKELAKDIEALRDEAIGSMRPAA